MAEAAVAIAAGRNRTLRRAYIGVLAFYFLVQMGGRLLWPGVFELDEGEQVVASQWFQWGYGAQPPLYTWLLGMLLTVVPHDLLALALLKNVLLFWTFTVVFLAAERIRGDTRIALLASASLMLIPQIAWESQRDLTHTVLVLAVAATTLWHFVGLGRSPTARGYAGLGALLGLGILAKYNFLVFAFALLLAGWRRLRDRRAWLVPACALAVVGPHAVWLCDHHAAAASVSRFVFGSPVAALASLAVALLTFLGPFVAAAFVCFARNRPRPMRDGPVLLRMYVAIALVLLVAGAMACGLARLADRWLQPILFVVPLLFFTGMERPPARRPTRVFLAACAVAAVLVAAGLAARPLLGPRFGPVVRLNYPFDGLADRMRARGFDGGVIIGRRGFLAATLLQRFEGSVAAAPRWILPRAEAEAARRDVCVVWEAGEDPRRLWELRRYVTRLALDLDSYPVHECALPMRHGGGDVVFRFVLRKKN